MVIKHLQWTQNYFKLKMIHYKRLSWVGVSNLSSHWHSGLAITYYDSNRFFKNFKAAHKYSWSSSFTERTDSYKKIPAQSICSLDIGYRFNKSELIDWCGESTGITTRLVWSLYMKYCFSDVSVYIVYHYQGWNDKICFRKHSHYMTWPQLQLDLIT